MSAQTQNFSTVIPLSDQTGVSTSELGHDFRFSAGRSETTSRFGAYAISGSPGGCGPISALRNARRPPERVIRGETDVEIDPGGVVIGAVL